MLVLFTLMVILVRASQCQEEMINEYLKAIADTYYNISEHNKNFPKKDQSAIFEKETYNFIIVGAGSAGSVIANRLSEVPHWKVLLLEAGDEPNEITDIPAVVPMLQFTDYNWKYQMEKDEKIGLGLRNQMMEWPRGKGLGGSSLTNYMVHTRGNRLDYDKWESLGNPGWSYDEVLPYFLKSENFLVEEGDPGYHRRGGTLEVEQASYRTKSAEVFLEAAKEIGLKIVDYNGRDQVGASYLQNTLRNGHRCSTEKAFLRPAQLRPNLKIVTRARVTKILIEPIHKHAYGVEYHRNEQYHRVEATDEVILSAGVFHSPQLLMLSGIGPKKSLENLKIALIQELPVGQKLYDHMMFLGLVFTVNETITTDAADLFSWSNLENFVTNGQGPLTLPMGIFEAISFIKSNISEEIFDYPDIELLFISGGLHSNNGSILKRTYSISDKIYNAIWKSLEGKAAWQLIPIVTSPQSYGHMELRSKNPFDPPKLYGNYLSDPADNDMKTFITSIRYVQKIAATSAFQKYNCQQVATPMPGCTTFRYDSDEYWECAIRHIATTVYHQSTTCKMGPRHDPEAVVNHKLQVYGVKRLRIADTSVFPTPLAAHTNVPAIMLGEKVADLIKEHYSAQTVLP